MGSGLSAAAKEERQRSRQIDEEMQRQQLEESRKIKLLLLGAGECGKSTVLKQMRIIHDNGFTEKEYELLKGVIFSNIVQSMVAIIRAMIVLEISFADDERKADEVIVMRTITNQTESEPFSIELKAALKSLWCDKGVLDCYAQSSKYHLNDSAKYFLDDIDRVCAPDYRPSQQDMLRARIKTTGIVETTFTMKLVKFRVFDVGGQRSERRKWIHCFDDVNAIIFIAALSEYDQFLFEDSLTNRMIESISLFESICNSLFFLKTTMILFLNKKDLFEEKIQTTPLTVVFSDYEGENEATACATFIRDRFVNQSKNPERRIYDHLTCATDTSQIQFVLEATIDMLVGKNVKDSGMS